MIVLASGRRPQVESFLRGVVLLELHSLVLGAELTVLTQEQADYIGLKVDGLFKSGRLQAC